MWMFGAVVASEAGGGLIFVDRALLCVDVDEVVGGWMCSEACIVLFW